MEKITFSDVSPLCVETFTKESPHHPKAEKLEPFKVYADKETRVLLTADEIPFFFFDKKSLSHGGAALSVTDVRGEIVLKRFKPLLAQYSFKPENIIVYLGPSLTFSHVLVERADILDLMNKGYRAATKRTDGVDFFDPRMMVVVMLRQLGIPFENIYLDNHDTFECEALLYSALRGDKKKNPSYLSLR